MSDQEITLEDLNVEEFIDTQVKAIKEAVGDDIAINALSGGVDSAAVTMLAHRAIGDNLKTYFIENGLMREGEAEQIVAWFKDLGVHVDLFDDELGSGRVAQVLDRLRPGDEVVALPCDLRRVGREALAQLVTGLVGVRRERDARQGPKDKTNRCL